MPLALLALAIGAFGIGTTEFVIMGLLPEVAAGYGVTIPTAGLLVTGYALGVVLGAPLLARVLGFEYRLRANQSWIALAGAGLVVDILLKWAWAPAWREMIRNVAGWQ